MVPDALSTIGWGESIRIVAATELAQELADRRDRAPPTRSLGVTDLVDPRSAYWRAVAPIEPTPERRAILDAGREAHLRVGQQLALARFREVRVQRQGIVGQIDLFEDRPTEIKTTRRTEEVDDIVGRRPAYVDQLGMYCALVGVPDARLILARSRDGGGLEANVYDGRFRALDPIWAEMLRRAQALQLALEHRDPAGLPRCPWKGRGCEFEAAERCDCRGDEVPLSSAIVDELTELRPNADLGRQLTERLRAGTASEPPAARRFRDLVYPRRTYFERTEPSPPGEGGRPALGRSAPDGLYREISDLLESGPAGEMTREAPDSGVPLESVACFRGIPILIKVTRAWNPPTVEGVLRAQPQYLLELGLRCAALGRDRGSLVVGYERRPDWADRVRAFDVRWSPMDPILSAYRTRSAELETAIRERTPGRLPAVPCVDVGGVRLSVPLRLRVRGGPGAREPVDHRRSAGRNPSRS